MILKEIVCHPEQSCLIKDLGFDEISIFCWWFDFSKESYGFIVEPYINDERSKTRAYTIGELMLRLPKKIGEYWMRVEPDDAGWNITYFYDGRVLGKKPLVSINDTNLAHCLADCFIWLLRNGHIKPEELKL